MTEPAALNPIDIDGDDDVENLRDYGRDYHDDRSWEDLQEDEFGNLHSVAEASEHAARRRRLLSSTVGARVRRGMIRYLQLVVDLSRAASLTDMRPVRSAIMFHVVQLFIRAFFDANPLSQLGIIVLRNGVAERLTELSSSPEVHIQKLKNNLDTGGAASLQNGFDLAVESLRRIPPYGHREVLVLLAALSSCDPGTILDSIKAAKLNKVRISVVGLAAEVHVCRVAATETGGSYEVGTSEAHLEQIMVDQATPPPSASGSSGVSLVRMGFPAKASSAPGAASFIGSTCELQPGAYICPRCKARVDALPAECHVCGLTLVSSPHLARSYHHLFPVRAFEEVSLEMLEKEGIGQGSGGGGVWGGFLSDEVAGIADKRIGVSNYPNGKQKLNGDSVSAGVTFRELPLPGSENTRYCYGCSSILEAPPVPRVPHGGRSSRAPPVAATGFATSSSFMVLRCPDCRRLFCLDCDAYVHERLHSCPGCECLPVKEQQQEK
ncbi:putative General transcription factor IIH subunit 2 [Nannochloris sp. 'desiccata']|nr:putative General transcription factor IIH subunit 2 [Chlorella desiccata (nom. nud.)]